MTSVLTLIVGATLQTIVLTSPLWEPPKDPFWKYQCNHATLAQAAFPDDLTESGVLGASLSYYHQPAVYQTTSGSLFGGQPAVTGKHVVLGLSFSNDFVSQVNLGFVGTPAYPTLLQLTGSGRSPVSY